MSENTEQHPARFDYDLNGTNEVTRRIRLAARQAMIDHKLSGSPVVGVVDGKTVTIAAEDIVIPDLDEINGTTR